MLKWLCGFAIVASAIVSVAYEQHYTREKYEAKRQEACIVLAISIEEKHACAKEAQSRKDYAPWWDVLVTWPEGITTWAIIATGFILAWQSSETRVAAKGAFLNAQAVINAERPWVLVSVKSPPGPMGGFTVHVRNKGRTPAMITEARMGCVAAKNVSELPLKAVFPIENLIRNRIIIPSGTAHITWFDQQLFKTVLQDNIPQFSWDGQIFVFGKVLYRDLANPDKTVIHETRWIGLYQPPVGDEGGNSIFRVEGLGISDEYDRYS
jgi:hypothetical protein